MVLCLISRHEGVCKRRSLYSTTQLSPRGRWHFRRLHGCASQVTSSFTLLHFLTDAETPPSLQHLMPRGRRWEGVLNSCGRQQRLVDGAGRPRRLRRYNNPLAGDSLHSAPLPLLLARPRHCTGTSCHLRQEKIKSRFVSRFAIHYFLN